MHKNCKCVRGVKSFKCLNCGANGTNYSNGVDICLDCISKLNLCRICGKPLDDNKEKDGENNG